MSYATPADMVARYGAEDMAGIGMPDDIPPGVMVSGELLRATIDGGDREGYADEQRLAADGTLARILGALEEASRRMDSYLQTRVTLPLGAEQVTASPMAGYCCDIARYLLQDDRATEEPRKRYEQAILWLRDVAGGRVSLGVTLETPGAVGLPDWVVSSPLLAPANLEGF